MRMLCLAGAALSALLVAGCQTQAPPDAGPRAGLGHRHAHMRADCPMADDHGRDHGMMGGQGMGHDAEAEAARLGRAKAEIGITAEQEAAWSAYVEAVTASRAAMTRMHDEMRAQPGAHAPDRMQAHLSVMSAHLASMQQVQAAAQTLYAALTEEQRQRADRVLWGHRGMRRGMH